MLRSVRVLGNNVNSNIVTFTIPKSRHRVRKIYTEKDPFAKYIFQIVANQLEQWVRNADTDNVVHAFVKGRNCVTNAMKHIGYKYTISYDLKDFFESVTRDKLTGIVSDDILDLIIVDGSTRQGLSSSPNAANLAFIKVDKEIMASICKSNIAFAYTRYADDITISFNYTNDLFKIDDIVRYWVTSNAYVINEHKTKLQCADQGRRFITGIAVDCTSVYPTRKNRRRARAAIHNELMWRQSHTGKFRLRKLHQRALGLSEWIKCKIPKEV